MIDAANNLHPGGLVALAPPLDRSADAGGRVAAAPGRLPRARTGAASQRRWLPDVLSARWWTLLFAQPNATARAQSQPRAAIFESWSDEGPQDFDALYGNNGSLRRDVVTALWQRIEPLLPAPLQMPDDGAASIVPEATDRPEDGTMTDLELHGLTEKLKRAEKMLGKRDSVELRAVRTLRDQVLGARGSLGRPRMVARAQALSDHYTHAGAASTFELKTDQGIPKLPFSAMIAPKIGATYSSGVEVADDLWISESRGIEARLGVVGHIKAFFLKLDLGLTGRLGRTKGRSYTDREHLLRAPGSSVYQAERQVTALRDLERAVSDSRGGRSRSFSLHSLDALRHKAYADYGEFAKTAAMLGIVLRQPQAEVEHHPLAQSHRTRGAAGTPFKTVSAGVKLQGGATLSATGEKSVLSAFGIHGTASVEGSKASTGVRTYVPVWNAFDAREAGRAGKDITQKRLDDLRAAFAPMLKALQNYYAQRIDIAPGAPMQPVPTQAAPGAALPRVLQAIASWQPGQPPVAAADLAGALHALAGELDLYCHAARLARDDARAGEVARSVEQAWGIEPKEGAYGYLRALAISTALIDKHARDTQTQPLAGYQALIARLAAPAMHHDDVLLRQATGFKDTLLVDSWTMEMALGADAGLALPPLRMGADVSGKVRGTRVAHFNVFKTGDFIDVDVRVGMAGSLGIGALIEPVTKWAGAHLGSAIGSLSQAGLPADFATTLGSLASGAVTSLSPSFGAQAHLVFTLRFSKPLAAPAQVGVVGAAAGTPADSESRAPAFNLEYARVSVRLDAAMNAESRPLGTVMGTSASRTVLSNLDNCYAKFDSREQGDAAARAYLASRAAKRGLPLVFASLGNEDSAAARQVRAFVREALAHADDSTAQALRGREAELFEAMRVYAAAQTRAADAPAGSALPAGSATSSRSDELNARARALPEYAAAEKALLALIVAMREPADTLLGKRTEYAPALGKLRIKA